MSPLALQCISKNASSCSRSKHTGALYTKPYHAAAAAAAAHAAADVDVY